MTSKTKINQKMKKKTNSTLVKTIFLAKKNNLLELAKHLSISTRKQAQVNVEKIQVAKKEVIIVPGKVLGSGEIKRKCKVYALAFSEEAKKKLNNAGCETKILIDVLKENKKLEGEILV